MEQQRVGIGGHLSRLWQRLWRGAERVMGRSDARGQAARRWLAPTPVTVPPAIYAQRERLYVCALQLLDDPQAARHVVAEALVGAAIALAQHEQGRGPDGRAGDGATQSQSEAELTSWLDRTVLRLALVRLRVTPQPMPIGDPLETRSEDDPAGRGGAIDGLGTDSTPPSVSDGVAQLERIGDALGTLPPEIRAVIALVVMQGRSLAATADLLDIREETCAFFLSHGRKLLRRALQRDLVAAEDILGAGSILLQPRDLHDLHGSKKATARA